ncbi:FdhD protein [Candidatus Magnetomoraceae bacterium gMMP-15]
MTQLSIEDAINCIDRLSMHQPVRKKTAASHGVILYDKKLNILSTKEDVGRHNAFDKAIGEVFLNKKLSIAYIGILSSRVSFDMIQKAGRAGLGIILSVSRPTALAVKLASQLNMTLACLSREGGLFIFCGKERLIL